MLIIFTIIAAVIIIYFLYKQLLKIDKESEDVEYINGLLKEYAAGDVADMVRLTQGLRDVQRIIEDKNITSVSLNMGSLSNLWTNNTKNKSIQNNKAVDGKTFWDNILSENSIKTEKPYNHQILNDFFDEIKEIVIDMPNKVSDDNILELVKYDALTIIWLLALLDKKGNCPSVVSPNRDDAIYKDDYTILRKYTLLDHSIRVAKNAIALLEKEDIGYFILLPTIIAALAHDIGKIPEFINKEDYTKQQHSAISVTILRKSSFFKLIPDERRDIIEKAILEHHGLVVKEKSNNPILAKLKESDHLARHAELTFYQDKKDALDADIMSDLVEKKDALDADIIPNPKEHLPEKVESEEIKPQEEEQETETIENPEPQKEETQEEPATEQIPEKVEPKEQTTDTKVKPFTGEKNNDTEIDDIPVVNEEFLKEFIRLIKAKINIVEKYSYENKPMYKFNAFTFKNSVYITSYALTIILANLFKEFGDEKTAEIMREEEKQKRRDSENTDKPYTRAILLYILKYLRNNGFISDEAFKPDFIGGYFDICDESNIPLHSKAYYTVFNINMFVENGDTIESTIQELEKRKHVSDNNYLLKFNKIFFHK